MKTMFMMWSVLASTATFSALACGGFAAAISEKQPRTQVGRKHTTAILRVPRMMHAVIPR